MIIRIRTVTRSPWECQGTHLGTNESPKFWGLMEVSAVVTVLKPVNVPCEEPVSLSWRYDTADNIHIMTPREKKSILFFQRMQGTSSNCCMALSTSPTFRTGKTLLQIHTTRQGRTFSTGHRGASTTAPLLNEAIRPHLTQLLSVTQTLKKHSNDKCEATIQVTFLKNIFITGKCSWCSIKKGRKKITGSKSKMAGTITSVDPWMQRSLLKVHFSKISKRRKKETKIQLTPKAVTDSMSL